MSEWFKEHDWKSCDWENWSGSSNLLLCANEKHTLMGVFFVDSKEEIEKPRLSEVRARSRANEATFLPHILLGDDALLRSNNIFPLRQRETHPHGCVFR